MGNLVGELYWRTPNGAMLELKRVSAKELRDANLSVHGIPTFYAVWPAPAEEENND
jgi:hypothetical protein